LREALEYCPEELLLHLAPLGLQRVYLLDG
jgi:hypothetical protein